MSCDPSPLKSPTRTDGVKFESTVAALLKTLTTVSFTSAVFGGASSFAWAGVGVPWAAVGSDGIDIG
jgi:hypothetical protein